MAAVIYKIICNVTGEVYIGSTINLKNRMYKHKYWNNTKSKQIIERGNYTFVVLEQFEVITKLDLRKKEQEYIMNTNCVNDRNAYIDKNKYDKEYQKEHREDIIQYNKDYYEQNREKIILQKKIYCEQNREAIKLKNRERYEQNREEIKLQKKIYYEQHKEAIKLQKKIYCEQNREAIKLKQNEKYALKKQELNKHLE
jgi:hypothetical protein